jgi:hypothetical protein
MFIHQSAIAVYKRLLAEVGNREQGTGNREQGTEADKTKHLQEV